MRALIGMSREGFWHTCGRLNVAADDRPFRRPNLLRDEVNWRQTGPWLSRRAMPLG